MPLPIQISMKLSVIVPVYNMASGDRLKWCMDSLVGQTSVSGYEIIAVDDCSTDDSLSILQDYEKRFPGLVRVFHSPENHHQGGAKNIGLSHASGEWLAFIDADDWVVPDYFYRLLEEAERTGADCVGTDYTIVPEHTMTPGRLVANNTPDQAGPVDDTRRRSLLLNHGSLCVKIWRREIILGCDTRFPEDIFYEDNAVANTWIMRIHRFAYLPGPLYYYYQHEDSTVHTVTKRRLEDRMAAGRILLAEAERYGYLKPFRPEIEYSFTVLFYKNTLFSAMQSLKEHGVYSFVTALAQEMKKVFPDFQQNHYYIENTDAEERKLVAMQMRSPRRFYVYYRLLWLYRRVRYGRKA